MHRWEGNELRGTVKQKGKKESQWRKDGKNEGDERKETGENMVKMRLRNYAYMKRTWIADTNTEKKLNSRFTRRQREKKDVTEIEK